MVYKRFIFFWLCFFLFLWGSMTTVWAVGDGRLGIQVEAPDGFHDTIMINLSGSAGDNYLLVAEPENRWRIETEIPAGEYQVDFVSLQSNDFIASYPETILIRDDGQDVLTMKITSREEENASKKKLNGPPGPSVSHRSSLEESVGNVLKQYAVSIIILLLLGVAWLLVGWKMNRGEE